MPFRFTLPGLTLFIAVIVISSQSFAQHKKTNTVTWLTPITLPVLQGMERQLGVAGAFAGVHNGVLLIAGGANFPDGMPWQGGKKLHRDDIYVLQKEKNDTFKWINAIAAHLEQQIAYGSSTTIPDGVVCIGGETERSGISKEAFIMQWDTVQKHVLFTSLPPLPIPLVNAFAASIGKIIYAGGGETVEKVSDAFFMLDLASEHPQWQVLTPLPIAMSHSVAVVQSNGSHLCIYVMGGRTATASGISELHNTAFCFDPAINKWKSLHPISDGRESTTLSAGTGVAIGATDILLMGGDKGNLFHKIETFNANIAKAKTDKERQTLQKEKLELLHHHPGFSRDIYLYHTVDDTWRKIGELPSYVQVTTTAVKWGNDILIPSGEIKPGVRAPTIMVGKILFQKR